MGNFVPLAAVQCYSSTCIYVCPMDTGIVVARLSPKASLESQWGLNLEFSNKESSCLLRYVEYNSSKPCVFSQPENIFQTCITLSFVFHFSSFIRGKKKDVSLLLQILESDFSQPYQSLDVLVEKIYPYQDPKLLLFSLHFNKHCGDFSRKC